MGYSISWEKWEKLEALRREGRLCAMDREHVTPATVVVEQVSWDYKVGEGPERKDEMAFCARHARQLPVGYVGTNFVVTGHRRLPRRISTAVAS